MALSGHHLIIAQEPVPTWLKIETPQDNPDQILKATGPTFDILEILSEKLNYTYTLIRPPDHAFGYKMKNGSYGGIVGLIYNKVVDFTMVPISYTEDRLPLVDYGATLHTEDFGLIIPRPKLEKDFFSFFRPFSLQIWFIIFASMFFGFAMGTLLQYLTNKFLKTPNGRSEVTFRFEWVYKPFIDEAATVLPTTDTGRIFLMTWLLAAFILMAAFKGILTSTLIVPIAFVPVNSLVELVKYGKYSWAVQKGTATLDGLRLSGIPEEDIFADKAYFHNGCFLDREVILKENRAFFCDQGSMLSILSDDFTRTATCNYYILKKRMYTSQFAPVFQKNSTIMKPINDMYMLFAESGLFSRMRKNAIPNAETCNVPPGKEKFKNISLTLTVSDLSGVFLMLCIGYLLSVAAFIGEIIYHKYQQNALN